MANIYDPQESVSIEMTNAQLIALKVYLGRAARLVGVPVAESTTLAFAKVQLKAIQVEYGISDDELNRATFGVPSAIAEIEARS